MSKYLLVGDFFGGIILRHNISESSLKLIQRCISLVPVTVLGSGASAAYGYAGMPQLAKYLIDIIRPEPKDEARWSDFITAIQSGKDLESALHEVSLSRELEREIVKKTRDLILAHDITVFQKVIRNEITLPLGRLLQHLGRTANQKIKVVTTNYDRLAEYAIDQAFLSMNNGFFGEYQKTFRGLPSATYEKVELLKVHGSLDWFLTDDSGVICVPDNIMDSIEMVPLMVTPGIRKYEHTHNEPFRSIIARADSAFENANSILCVGYGFNDNHIQPKLIDKMRQGKTPILIATKKLSDSAMRFIKSATSSTVFGIEEFKSGTRIVFSDKEEIIEELSFWSLEELIKLVI